jgi:hypothetical protein
MAQKNEMNSTSGKIWKVLRWVPLGLMVFFLLSLLGMMLAGGMMRISGWYLLQLLPPLLGIITLITIVIYALLKKRVKKRASRPLIWTGIVSLVSLLPLILWFVPLAYPASLEKTTPSATVRLPSNLPLRVVWGGNSIKTNYHAAAPDQRWAYDLVIEPYFSGSSKLEDYGCYDTPVVAPIGGKIVSAHDGESDEIPGVVSNNFEAPTGNHVVILMETNTYLVIAHLKKDSVAVKTEDIVKEGQEIGLCGNSGNTSEPHIHIHHQRQDPTVFPINFAEGLPLYFRDHDGQSMPVGGVRFEGDVLFAEGDLIRHLGK